MLKYLIAVVFACSGLAAQQPVSPSLYYQKPMTQEQIEAEFAKLDFDHLLTTLFQIGISILSFTPLITYVHLDYINPEVPWGGFSPRGNFNHFMKIKGEALKHGALGSIPFLILLGVVTVAKHTVNQHREELAALAGTDSAIITEEQTEL